MNSFLLYNENTKAADLIMSCPKLLFVIPRFGIKLGFGEATVNQICTKAGISTSLFLLICNVYSHIGYLPEPEELEAINVSELLDYLKKSHNNYKNNQIPTLQEKILKVACDCGPKGKSLTNFFKIYINEIIQHFEFEETMVYPYITGLTNKETSKGFTIKTYERKHTNIEEKLEDLKNILIKYIPEVVTEDHQEVLLSLFQFEEDLNRHSLIENKILVPLVTTLEQKANKK